MLLKISFSQASLFAMFTAIILLGVASSARGPMCSQSHRRDRG
jgi:hypothetical protein